ncbi:sensor histidine kinase [Ornithinibacillus sp. BX22]|uniref:Sensor histidine kinase n=2 Tax=Ornithinibacillus TaxID=484508 RepID=A0A923RJN0_9BACI|nr:MULTISPECIES: sensor histidine kinase [Ornithinibacillus]MBC5638120.1 sensor histidine kinase [Ornithinibacillus hominis]MBS3680809.1 sensor histidine kinase [Ornithinibacillus massiliensis]
MMTVLRHMMIGIMYSLVLVVLSVGLTFFLQDEFSWSMLWEKQIGDVSFLLTVLGIATISGAILGISIGWYWKQRIQYVERKLDNVIKGQHTDIDTDSYKELKRLEQKIKQLQEKINKQAEHFQTLATKRAEEREQSLQEIVVQERNRLARELHDSVSQELFAASMMMSAINDTAIELDSKIKKQLRLVENMIQQSQLEMRALLLHLRPVALKGKSLLEGVEELLKELIQKVPMDISWKAEDFQLDKGVEDQLFRILQESVSNTLRHAKATTLYVMLIKRDNIAILRVKDNGVGFDMNTVKTGSYGLQNMKERALEVGGTIKIISLPNQGTQLEVKVPIIRKEGEHGD